MGCDSKLYLPPSTTLDDFAEVLGILLGHEATIYTIAGSSGVFVEVKDGPHFESTSIPTMARLDIGGTWHWENPESPIPGARCFLCSTQEHRRPVLLVLADIFGGMLDFNDCDNIDYDYVGSLYNKPYRPDATDDAGWDQWQRYKLTIRPVAERW